MSQASEFDVVVLGGGVSGLTAALQLQQERPQTRIAVVEKREHPVPDTAWKVGESIAEVAAHYLKDVIGLEDYLRDHHLRKMGLRWYCTNGTNDDISRRIEFGLIRYSPLANFHLDRGAIENHLAELADSRGIAVLEGTTIKSIDIGTADHVVTVARNGQSRELRGRWVVDGTGRAAMLRRQLGLGMDLPIDANASWWRTPTRMCVDEWSDDPAWRAQVPSGTRWKSTVSFVGEGYWIWVINLGSGACSVGIVADPRFIPWERIRRYDAAIEWMSEVEPLLASKMPPESELLDFHKRMQFSANCTRAFSRHRWALVGEAALFLDPLYSTGHDFASIANTLATDLIRHDLDGMPESDLKKRVRSHNRAFLGIVQLGLDVFPGQLAVYRDPQATAGKFLWDNASYFTILLNLFRNGHITDPDFVRRLQPTLIVNQALNKTMQGAFRQWSHPEWDAREAGVPIGHDHLIEHLFTTPLRDFTQEELYEHIVMSVRRLHTLSREMIERMSEAAGRDAPEPTYDAPAPVDEPVLHWSDWSRRTGPPAAMEPQPEDGWLIR
jgi:flavin-dependent dehydrogenase